MRQSSRINLLIAFAILLPCPFLRAADAPAPTWRAGVASAKITPAAPIWMAGYGARTKPAEGTLNDLWVKALLLQDPASKRVLLITLDVCGMDRETSDHIRDGVKQKLGLDRDAVAVCASHTHSGPVIGHNLRATYPFGDDEAEKIRKYTAWMEGVVIDTATRAAVDLKPAALNYGVGQAGFAVNRRNNKEAEINKLFAAGPPPADWRTKLNGPFDHDLPVLSVVAEGKPQAIVFGYSCHATTLDGYDWCGDWPSFACEAIQQANPSATAMFVAGCGADQNPLPRRSVERAKGYGKEAADGVMKVMAGEMRPIDGKIATDYREIDLPFGEMPTRELLEQQKASKDPKDRFLARRAGFLLERLARDGKLQDKYAYPVQKWQLGEKGPTMILIGGEVVVDYALRFKKELGGSAAVWPISYANDVMAYVPSKRVLDEGGYEGGGAMVFYGLPAPWGAEVEEKIVAEVKRQAK